jgi:hypothetical protein
MPWPGTPKYSPRKRLLPLSQGPRQVTAAAARSKARPQPGGEGVHEKRRVKSCEFFCFCVCVFRVGGSTIFITCFLTQFLTHFLTHPRAAVSHALSHAPQGSFSRSFSCSFSRSFSFHPMAISQPLVFMGSGYVVSQKTGGLGDKKQRIEMRFSFCRLWNLTLYNIPIHKQADTSRHVEQRARRHRCPLCSLINNTSSNNNSIRQASRQQVGGLVGHFSSEPEFLRRTLFVEPSILRWTP